MINIHSTHDFRLFYKIKMRSNLYGKLDFSTYSLLSDQGNVAIILFCIFQNRHFDELQ